MDILWVWVFAHNDISKERSSGCLYIKYAYLFSIFQISGESETKWTGLGVLVWLEEPGVLAWLRDVDGIEWLAFGAFSLSSQAVKPFFH